MQEMRKQNFTEKAAQLVMVIRERGELSKSEACTVLRVGPWMIKDYAEYIVAEFVGVRFDGHRFWTVVHPIATGLKPLTEFPQERER